MNIKKIIKIFAIITAALFLILSAFLIVKAREASKGNEEVQEQIMNTSYDKLESYGAVKTLSILPLVDYYKAGDDFKTEAGAAYLIKADETTILMDAGYNEKAEHPSPLVYNMRKLNIKFSDIDMIFISHTHPDHLGGTMEMAEKTFSFSRGKILIGEIPVYAPEEIEPSQWNPGPVVEVIKSPKIIKPGIISTGVIPGYQYIMGLTLEHFLAINLEDKGIVLIIGCGHPTIGRIIERARMLFNEPIYAVIGGLHYPVNGGRINIGMINIQYIVASSNPPWSGLTENDVIRAIKKLKSVNPSIVSISPHDSSDWALSEFKEAFGSSYKDLRVGDEITL